MRLPSSALVAALALVPTNASAKSDRAAEIFEAVQLCKAELTDSQIAAGLRAANWRDVTPSLGGRSMASVTGATQYRRNSDEAMVSIEGSIAGQNCQFDFRQVKPEAEAAVVAKLDELFGPHTTNASGMMEWKNGKDGYGLLRRSDRLTILWLPVQEQQG